MSKGKLADVPRDIHAEPGDRRLIPPANGRRRAHGQGFSCARDRDLEGEPVLLEQYRAQVAEYCAAMRRLYARRQVSGAMVFADGEVILVAGG